MPRKLGFTPLILLLVIGFAGLGAFAVFSSTQTQSPDFPKTFTRVQGSTSNPTITPQPTSPPTPYSNPKSQFSLEIPSGWHAEDYPRTTLISPDTSNAANQSLSIWLPFVKTLDSYIKEKEKLNAVVEISGNTDLGGLSATRITEAGKNYIFLERESTPLLIEYDPQSPIHTQILASFKFQN